MSATAVAAVIPLPVNPETFNRCDGGPCVLPRFFPTSVSWGGVLSPPVSSPPLLREFFGRVSGSCQGLSLSIRRVLFVSVAVGWISEVPKS